MSEGAPKPHVGWLQAGWLSLTLGTWAVAAPGLAATALAVPQPAANSVPGVAGAAPFDPPGHALILTRELHHVLPNGKGVMIRRAYRIHILHDGRGYRVKGEMIDVTIEVPPKLAPLAELERGRPQPRIFPIYLDADGRLAESAPSQDQQDQGVAGGAGQARTISGELIDGAHLDDNVRADIRRFTRDVLAGRNEDRWPTDLFHPICGLRSDTSHFTTAGGGHGTISVVINAGCDTSGLLKSYERAVTTDKGGETQTTREVWTLVQDPAP